MSQLNSFARTLTIPRWSACLGVLLGTALYCGFLAANSTIVAGGSDSSGYLNSARLLAAGRLQADLRVPVEFGPQAALDRSHFTPLGFFSYAGNPRLTPTYPSGLPLHFALGSRIFGWRIGLLVIEIGAAFGAIVLCYAVARELGLGGWFATAGAVTLGLCPVFLFSSIQPLSDTLATLWCLAAMLAALRSRRTAGWAGACGAALGIAVLVRPTNIVLLPALVVVLGFDWRRLGLAILGGLPALVWLALYNRALYGGVLRSGYGDLQDAFALHNAWPTTRHFAHWLVLLLPAILVGLPFAAIMRPAGRGRHLTALALWFGAITGLYACYEVSHEVWWCLRFILPGIPALIIGGLLGLETISMLIPVRWADRYRIGVALMLGGWAIGGSWYWTRKLGVQYIRGYEQVYADATHAAKAQLPPNALVVAFHLSGALYYYTEFPVLRWDTADTADFAHYAALAQKTGRPICAVLYDVEVSDALHGHFPGAWERIGTVKNVGLWRLTPSPAAPGMPR